MTRKKTVAQICALIALLIVWAQGDPEGLAKPTLVGFLLAECVWVLLSSCLSNHWPCLHTFLIFCFPVNFKIDLNCMVHTDPVTLSSSQGGRRKREI